MVFKLPGTSTLGKLKVEIYNEFDNYFQFFSDACKWGVSCPVKSGSSQELKLAVPVSTSYPKIQLTVRVAVTDASSAFLFCKEFPVQIQ